MPFHRYFASNMFLNAFARNRTHSGRPAISIDVGMIAGEGIAAENEHIAMSHRRLGMRQYTIDKFLAVVNFAMTNCVASRPENAQIILGNRHEVLDSFHDEASQKYRDPKFLHVYTRTSGHHHRVSGGKEVIFDIQAALRTVSTPEMAKELTRRALRSKVAQLLVLPEQDLQPVR